MKRNVALERTNGSCPSLPEPVQDLLEEHAMIRTMLFIFGRELAKFGVAEATDYDILEGSIAFCRDCLDRWHHPREDALLSLLRRRNPQAAVVCEALETQHQELARKSRDMVRVFEAVERGAFHLRDDLTRLGLRLICEYRNHLDWEEIQFFPAISAFLSEGDFSIIEQRFRTDVLDMWASMADRRYRAVFDALEGA